MLTSCLVNSHSITHPQTQKLEQRLQVSANKVIVNSV